MTKSPQQNIRLPKNLSPHTLLTHLNAAPPNASNSLPPSSSPPPAPNHHRPSPTHARRSRSEPSRRSLVLGSLVAAAVHLHGLHRLGARHARPRRRGDRGGHGGGRRGNRVRPGAGPEVLALAGRTGDRPRAAVRSENWEGKTKTMILGGR